NCGKLRVAQKLIHVYHVAVEFRKDRRGAADRHEPEDQKMQKQRNEVDAAHHDFSLQAAKIATGARVPMIHNNGQRMTPTPTKASATNTQGRHSLGNTIANLITVPSSSAAATMDMPARARCTCGRAP